VRLERAEQKPQLSKLRGIHLPHHWRSGLRLAFVSQAPGNKLIHRMVFPTLQVGRRYPSVSPRAAENRTPEAGVGL